MVEGLRRQPVRLDHQGDRRGLHRDLHVVEPDLGEVGQFHAGRFDQGLGGRASEAFVEIGVQGPGVDPDADGHTPVLGLGRHLLDLDRLAEVARVEPQTLDAGLERGQRHLVVEVDVGDDGYGRAGHDPGQALRRRLLVAGAPDQVGPGCGQRVDLAQGGLGVGCLGGGHRLDGDRCAAAHGHVAHTDLTGGSAFGRGPGRSSHGPMLGRKGPAPAGSGQPNGLATGWKMSVSRAGTTRMAMTRMNSQVNGISLATSAWYMTLRRPVRIFS
jgi:hypothetical protein